jgi:hypothetical protein
MLVQLLCQEFARQLLPENPKVKLLSMLHKFMLFAQKPIYTINQESCATGIHGHHQTTPLTTMSKS